MELAHDFAELFSGRTDAIGLGLGRVERRPVTVLDYAGHLNGDGSGIGIFPMLDDNTVWFGAIDLDEPNFKLAAAMQLLLPGPTYIEQSRSGNAHVWAFFEAPAPAWAVRAVMHGALQSVGRTNVEVFPKQDQLYGPTALGNYINLPYHGRNSRVVFETVTSSGGVGVALGPEAFVELALETRHHPSTWEHRARRLGAVAPEEREAPSSEWGQQPALHECAAYIVEGAVTGERPLRRGQRHVVLFNLSKQLLNYRDMTTQEALDIIHQVNDASEKPLYKGEVNRIFRNCVVRQYTSTGCDDPIMQEYVHPDCPIANGRRHT